MNTTTSITASVEPPPTAIPAFVAAILATFIDALKPTIYVLIVSAIWLGIAIPLLIILFYTSSQTSRKSGLFISNAIGICLGITLGGLSVAIQTQAIFNPLTGLSRSTVIAYTFLSTTIGLYVDCILFFRVLVVFPKFRTPRRLWYGIMIPLVLLKIARFTNITLFVTQFVKKSKNFTNNSQYEGPMLKSLFEENVEWVLQLADNALCSGLFLWKLYEAQSSSIVSRLKSSPYHKSLAALFWIAAVNFVFPCLFDIALFVLFLKEANSAFYLIVVITNEHVQIIGVLFATIWRATHTVGTEVESALPQTHALSIRFASNRNTNIGSNDAISAREKEPATGLQHEDLYPGSSTDEQSAHLQLSV